MVDPRMVTAWSVGVDPMVVTAWNAGVFDSKVVTAWSAHHLLAVRLLRE